MGILDILGGQFAPMDAEGNVQAPMGGFGANQNALIGLGLGLMGGTRERPFENALKGFQTGAAADQNARYREQILKAKRFDDLIKAAQLRALIQKESRPTLETITPPGGGDPYSVERFPDGTTRLPVAPQGTTPASDQPAMTKTMRQQMEKQTAEMESATVSAGREAASVLPEVDKALAAWDDMEKNEAIGPYRGSAAARFYGNYIAPRGAPGHYPEGMKALSAEAETSRQNFERAMGPLKSYVTRLQLKGQGQVTEWERKLSLLTLPGFTDQDPKFQRQVIADIRAGLEKSVKDAEASPLSRTPSIRESITPRQSGNTQGGAAPRQGSDDVRAEVLAQARRAIASGANRKAVIERLREKGFDPSGL